ESSGFINSGFDSSLTTLCVQQHNDGPNYRNQERISASIKVGVSGSVSRQARKKGPGAPGKQNR
ncbi:unnamed protein product, partial [Brassica rapa subsp. trilocularis]